jgi:hypothetical protein
MDKKTALESQPEGVLARLFYQARNLAIESMLLRLESLLLREGFPAKCVWRESSNSSPLWEIQYLNKDTSPDAPWCHASARVIMSRKPMQVFDKDLSALFYEVESVSSSEYWARKQPKHMLQFRDRIEELRRAGYFEAEVLKINYPFDRLFLSSF